MPATMPWELSFRGRSSQPPLRPRNGKVAQPHQIARASLGKGDDIVGDNQRCRVIAIDQSQHLDRVLIVLHYDRGTYRFDGLYDAGWVNANSGWSDIEVENIIFALCGDYNDRQNSRAHHYALYPDPRGRPCSHVALDLRRAALRA